MLPAPPLPACCSLLTLCSRWFSLPCSLASQLEEAGRDLSERGRAAAHGRWRRRRRAGSGRQLRGQLGEVGASLSSAGGSPVAHCIRVDNYHQGSCETCGSAGARRTAPRRALRAVIGGSGVPGRLSCPSRTRHITSHRGGALGPPLVKAGLCLRRKYTCCPQKELANPFFAVHATRDAFFRKARRQVWRRYYAATWSWQKL